MNHRFDAIKGPFSDTSRSLAIAGQLRLIGAVYSCNSSDTNLSLGEGNEEIGSLSGTLIAGHVHFLNTRVLNRGSPNISPTIGNGLIRLSFLQEPDPAVPAPSLSPLGIALLWSLLGLAGWRWLRRQP